MSAVLELLVARVGHETYHLFSHAIDRYKEAKEREKRNKGIVECTLFRLRQNRY